MLAVRLALILVVAVSFVMLILLSLGLMSIPGNGQPSMRFRLHDASPEFERGAWSFDDLAPGSLPAGSEVLSQPRFGGWAVREEPDAPSPPNALCQTGVAEFPSIAL